MKRQIRFPLLLAFALSAVSTPTLMAQIKRQSLPSVRMTNNQSRPYVLIPDSAIERPWDIGVRAHTNHLIRLKGQPGPSTQVAGETPQSISAAYNLPYPPTGGSGTIAIVTAYNYPTAENDLNVFSSQFGLPACTIANGCFKVVYAGGKQPHTNCGWAQEAALDIEWAHAMAPAAKIVLVEASSNQFRDLFQAVDVATSIVTTGGGKGQVSMSWASSEFSGELGYDSHFIGNTGVVYVAANGDVGGVPVYPAASPYVVSVGGTSLFRNSLGNLTETAWSNSGGGPSQYELKPSYQQGVPGTDATQRSTPDISFDGDPFSGVAVYTSTPCKKLTGWLMLGGTSVGTQTLAGIINRAGSFANDNAAELTTIYGNYTDTTAFRDIVSGTAGTYSAGSGYDFVTGVGSSLGLAGK